MWCCDTDLNSTFAFETTMARFVHSVKYLPDFFFNSLHAQTVQGKAINLYLTVVVSFAHW